MKRILFFSILVLVTFVIPLYIVISFFNRTFSVVVYKKYPQSEFVKFIKESKITQVNKNYELPEIKPGESIDIKRPHPYCGFKAQAAVKVNGDYYTNALGHRSPTLGRKEKGVIRIALIGSSSAFLGTTNDLTIIGILAGLMKKEGLKVEYINAAIVSAISNQELSVVVHDILDLDVDLLISFDGYNDITHPMYYNGRIGWPPFRWDTTKGHLTRPGDNTQAAPSYYPALEPTGENMEGEKFEEIVNNYLNTIHKIAAICKAFNITYIAILQPLRGFDQECCQSPQQPKLEKLFYCTVIKTFERWDRERELGATYQSFADYLTNKDGLFYDECHFSDEGNALIATRILEIIKTRKLVTNY